MDGRTWFEYVVKASAPSTATDIVKAMFPGAMYVSRIA
jgi:hypothetical protein